MARPSSYTPGEDAIILGTAGLEVVETNRLLVASGYPERTPGAISGRRAYLKNRPGRGLGLQALLERRNALLQAVERSQEALDLVEAELKEALEKAQEELKGAR